MRCRGLLNGILMFLLVVAFPTTGRGADIAVYGEIDPAPIVAQGHNVTVLTLAQLEAGGLAGYDVLLLGHILGDPGWSASACSTVEDFLSGGGGVIAEWNAAGVLLTDVGTNPWLAVEPRCSLFAGVVDGGDVQAFGTPISISDPLSPLVSGLSDGFDMGDGSESFVVLSDLGNSWVNPAGFTGTSGSAPALLAARYNRAGWAVVAAMDLFDAFGWGGEREAAANTLLSNLITVAQWPECQPDGNPPVDAGDLCVEIRALTDPGFTPPGHADCLPADGLAASDLTSLLESIFMP